MKNILLCLSIFFLSVLVISALDFTPQGNINLREVYNITGATYVNATTYYGNGSQLTGILTAANEGNFNVNSSNYWSTYDNANSSWFERLSGDLSLKLSQLTTQLDTWLGTKDTDDLTQGSTNYYDNRTWNETRGEYLFAPNSTVGIQYLINATGVYRTDNSTYANYADNVSRNWTLDTYNNWNIIWSTDTDTNYSHLSNFTDDILASFNHTSQVYTNWNTPWLSTYNATYDNYKINVSRNWTLDTYTNWNIVWLSTYNATYDNYKTNVSLNYTDITFDTYDSRWYQVLWDAVFNTSFSDLDQDTSYNATYDAYKTNVSINWTLDTYTNWNTGWTTTYNATYALYNDTTATDTYCTGSTTYLDGGGACDDISGIYVDVGGDTMTGNLNMGYYNITNINYTHFQGGGYIYDNGTALILGHT